jgi:hypothetical protein
VEAKKAAVRNSLSVGIRIGTITAIDRTPGGRPKLWLLDPPIHFADRVPRATKLISRLDFLRRVLALVNPTSPLVVALTTRVLDLEHLNAATAIMTNPGSASKDAAHRRPATPDCGAMGV